MAIARIISLIGLSLFLSVSLAGAGGLDVAAPIGPYLGGALPSRAPTAASGDWELVQAFPNQVFVDPVAMLPVPNSNLLIVAEKWGGLMIFPDEPDISARNVILDLSARTQAQGDSGLLGLAFHPEFGQEGSPNRDYLYVYYRYTPDPSELNRAYCRLSRFTWRSGPGAVDPASEMVLVNQYDRHNWHNGGGLFFGEDGFLYFSIGDEGGSNDAYSVTQKRGGGLFSGVFRIDVDRDPARSHPIVRQPVEASPPPPGWPASFTQGYYIPNDNPWLSPGGTELEEYWSIGVRSPYRMTIDRSTGRIWLGDVGQSLEEEVNLIERGGNYQWPFFEGTQPGARPRPETLTGTEMPPLLRYGRGEGGCVIGGFVYRGSDHPSLVGKYLYGDFNNGRIRSLELVPGGPPLVEEIAEVPDRQLTSFGTDARGEVYLLTIGQTNLNGGLVYRLRLNGAARPQPPATLSATGAFTSLANLTPRSGLVPYDLVQALWSDGADKKRWLSIPNDGTPDTPGEQIGFSENGPWDFPIGTVIVKHFEYAGRRLETRFLVRGEDGKFFGFTYRWRADHSDADLLPGPAVEETIPLAAGGSLRWHFPGRVECFECHTDVSGIVLGPKTRHLQRDLYYPVTGRTANQIETWNDLGFFRNAPDPGAIPGFLTAAKVTDETESLDRRARSYLDINCSHCHLPGGPTQAGFDARLTTPPHFQNLIGVAPGNGLDFVDPALVKPGIPAQSVLPFRMDSLDTCCAMPPIAKNAVDADAVRVINEWITSLDPATSPTGRNDNPVPADLTLPQLTFDLPGGPVVNRYFQLAITASEPVFGLAADDFVVTNGKILAFAGSGSSYTLTIEPRIEGAGSVSLLSDRFVDANGHANRRLAPAFLFTYDDPATTGPLTNLLSGGGFESGLDPWRRGGDTGLTPVARSGTRGVRLSGPAWLMQSVAVSAATDYEFSGWSRLSDGGTPAEAIISFWNAEGVWISERRITLSAVGEYDSFRLRLTSPVGAVLASVTILTNQLNALLLDDLSLTPGASGDPPATPLTENGDFERGLLFWDVINDVTLSPSPHLGTGAALLGPDSSISFSRPILAGNRLVMTGTAFTGGNPVLSQAGLSFWTAADELVASRSITLPISATYQDFYFFADVPDAADHLTMWLRNEAGGTLTVDDLGLIYVIDGPAPDPLSPDTGFELGSPDPWRSGGSVALGAPGHSGNSSALLGEASYLETSRATSPGATVRFQGHYRGTGDWKVREAGLVFYDREGLAVGQSTRRLPSASVFVPFELTAIAPASAVAVSAWLYQGEGGALTVDDLELTSLSGNIAPPPAGVEASSHVRVAGHVSHAQLGERDPGRYTDPGDNRIQPDLAVQVIGSPAVGDDLYPSAGFRQTVTAIIKRRKASATYGVSWENDAVARVDAARLRGTRGNSKYALTYFQITPEAGNRTAGFITGSYQTPDAVPGVGASYQVKLRGVRTSRRYRFQATVTARSVADPSVIDEVEVRLR